MSAELSFRPPGFEQLNRRRLEIWPDRSDDQMALRMRRATSWLERAELALAAKDQEGYDSACIFYWISLNAAYAQDIPVNLVRGKKWTDSDGFKKFADKVVERDPEQSLAKLIFERLREDILRLTEDVYLFKDFWLARNGTLSGQGWKSRFKKENNTARRFLMTGDFRVVRDVLPSIFDRLYVLRNQLIHGGATWNGSVNRNQVAHGARIMSFLVPTLVSIMLEDAEADWGPCFYQPTLNEQFTAVQSALYLPE